MELTFFECAACTRASAEYLKVGGEIVARGREAGAIYNGDLPEFLASLRSKQQGQLF